MAVQDTPKLKDAATPAAHWDGTTETELTITEETKATIRAIPLKPLKPGDDEPGVCIYSGKPSQRRVVIAKAY